MKDQLPFSLAPYGTYKALEINPIDCSFAPLHAIHYLERAYARERVRLW